jgi:hypothetical protein
MNEEFVPAICTEVGNNYRAIDDLRLKLLGLLPLATGTGILLLLRGGTSAAAVTVPAGVFGCLTTVALGIFELHGVEKCGHYIHRGQHLETIAQQPGSFTSTLRWRPVLAWTHLAQPEKAVAALEQGLATSPVA